METEQSRDRLISQKPGVSRQTTNDEPAVVITERGFADGGPDQRKQSDDQSGELVSEYPEAGLSFELPEVQGPETAILEAFLQFESERWIAQRDTREISTELLGAPTGERRSLYG